MEPLLSSSKIVLKELFWFPPGVTAWSGDPFVALTAAWALSAVTERTKSKASSAALDGPWKETFSGLANFESMLVNVLFVVAVAAPAWHLLK